MFAVGVPLKGVLGDAVEAVVDVDRLLVRAGEEAGRVMGLGRRRGLGCAALAGGTGAGLL